MLPGYLGPMLLRGDAYHMGSHAGAWERDFIPSVPLCLFSNRTGEKFLEVLQNISGL